MNFIECGQGGGGQQIRKFCGRHMCMVPLRSFCRSQLTLTPSQVLRVEVLQFKGLEKSSYTFRHIARLPSANS